MSRKEDKDISKPSTPSLNSGLSLLRYSISFFFFISSSAFLSGEAEETDSDLGRFKLGLSALDKRNMVTSL